MIKTRGTWIASNQKWILGVSLFIMLTGNWSFMEHILETYPIADGNLLFVSSIVILFTCTSALFLNIMTYRRSTPWVLAFFLFASSSAAYFMDRYGTVIDYEMLQNMLQTNVNEAGDLLSISMAVRLLLLGILPGYLVIRFRPAVSGHLAELKSKGLLSLGLIALMLLCIVPFSSQYASFFREHKQLRFYANPTYFSYSLVRLVSIELKGLENSEPLRNLAQDANLIEVTDHTDRKELIIVVVGETARADRFALNGYSKPTNPVLSKEDLISFKNVTSCGTSTAISVPCMFSNMKADEFDVQKALKTENVLDILQRNGVEVLWRDNNSDSKGVAARVPYEDFKTSKTNPACDEECRDVGMLSGLKEYVAQRKGKDILIVLHQMGNHGPAYYKRYPKSFEKFKPVCETNELSKCSKEEIDNAYDNAIAYTDYFLGEVIGFLKAHNSSHETAMLYISDHGESLGEYGMYLHGAPRAFAPKEQTHVASVLWLGPHFDYKLEDVKPYENAPLRHENLFCTLLLAYEMDTSLCPDGRKVMKTSHRNAQQLRLSEQETFRRTD